MTHFFRFYNRLATPLRPAVTLGAGAAITAVIITCLMATIGVQPATAQDGNIPTTLRSSSLFVRGGLHNGNRVKTRFVNTGLIGGNANPPTCAWPTENNPYLYDAGVIFGVEKVFRDTILYPITSAFPNGDTTSATGTRLRDNTPNKSTRAGARGVSGGVQEFLGNVLVGGNYGASVAMPEKYTTTHLGPRGAGYKIVNGAFSGLQPVPGFFNNSGNNQSLAMSHLPNSWPAEWPDHPDWKNAATGKANWNGYFGRDVFNADQESYFVTDDANDLTFEAEYKYRPIPTEPDRAGLGLQVKVRGLQWANFLAQDNVFWVYEVKNVSKFDYDKVVFASIAGTAVANTFQNISLFDQSRQITYTYNPPNIPPSQPWNNLYTPGYVGLAFLESPGNPFDGIDNDDSYGEEADPITGPRVNPYGNLITRESVVVPGNAAATGSDAFAFIGGEIPDQFRKSGGGTSPAFTNTGYEFDEVKGEPVPRVLKASDWLITIEQKSIPPPGGRYPAGVTIAIYERSALQLPASGSLTLTSLGKIYTVKVGDTLRETPQNNFDDNLNGVV
ncbi:MAG: hypothetical protein IAF08_11120, partial [Rhizobacter sp.]|nr:hypothetical protein [Chlorobiales bacterium]